jgi:hypothetical protein
MRLLTAAVCFGAAIALSAPVAQGTGISNKTKAKKVQGDLVPAYSPADTGPGTGDDENEGTNTALLDTPVARTNCTFESGKFKLQVGKDAAVKIKGMTCGGTPYSGSICAHTKTLATIMDEEIDKDGNSTPASCISPALTETANTQQFVTGNVGVITCTAGSCQGTIPPVATDPCPDVDKVTELRRIEVFNGPAVGSLTYSGVVLKTCCGPGQTVAGFLPPIPACNAPGQDVMGEMGYISQGVAP